MDETKQIIAAERIYADQGKALSEDEVLAPLLAQYRRAILAASECMVQEGAVGACATCAGKPRGSCCFRGVEEWYDPVLLLINLLLGRKIPVTRLGSEDCLFLGPAGCRLLARHSFCVNYLCPDIQKLLEGGPLKRLAAAVGEELRCAWAVEQFLHIRLRRTGLPGIGQSQPFRAPRAVQPPGRDD